jgi:hypothetical protein
MVWISGKQYVKAARDVEKGNISQGRCEKGNTSQERPKIRKLVISCHTTYSVTTLPSRSLRISWKV